MRLEQAGSWSKGDPVDTAPFSLTMREWPEGIAVEALP